MNKTGDVEALKAALKGHLKDFEIKLGLPSEDVIQGIVRDQKPKKLNSRQVAALKRTIISILASKQDSQDLEKKLGPYSASSKSFERIEKHLGKLRSELSKNIEQIEYFLADDIRDSLAHLVVRPLLSRSEGHMGQLYLDIVDALSSSVKKRVDLNRSNAGGRPVIWTRDLVLEMLAENSEAIIGTPATATAGGDFVKLCDSVLRALGLSARGVEKAVEQKLRSLSRRKIETSTRGARR
jgi:hypothetical protein